MHESDAERQPNTSFETLFASFSHVDVLIKPGNNESMSFLLERYSYLFSSEKNVRLYTQYQPKSNGNWRQEHALTVLYDNLPFGNETDSERILDCKIDQARLMTRLLFFPPKDRNIAIARKEIFETLQSSPLLDTLIDLKNTAYMLIEGVHLLNVYEGDDMNEQLLLHMFYSGEKYMPKEYDEFSYGFSDEERPIEETVAYVVSQRINSILKGLEALKHFRDIVSTSTDKRLRERFAIFFETINEWEEKIYSVFPMDKALSNENREKYSYDIAWDLFKNIEQNLISVGAALEWAKKIRDEQWGTVTLDPTRTDGYVGAWNLEESKIGQVMNSCPEDSTVLVLCGPNTSGKSYFMRTDLLVRLAAQSFMYAPVESGNIVPYDGYFFLDRASTDSANDLSAFMSEIKDKNEVFGKLHGRNRIYMDEAYSTTAPDGQARLLYATAQAIVEEGGSVVLGTHNDVFLDRLQKGGTDVWHLKTTLGNDGELQRFFSLEPGVGESHSIAAARARNLSTEFIAKAEMYIQGHIEFPVIKSRIFTQVVPYSEASRNLLKQEIRSLSHLFAGDKTHSIFRLFSFDHDFQLHRLFSDKRIPEGIEPHGFDRQKLELLLSTMVLRNSGLASYELLERQQLFGQLLDQGRYEKIFDLSGPLVFFDYTHDQIRHAYEVGILKALYPLHEKPDHLDMEDTSIYLPYQISFADFYYMNILKKIFPSDLEIIYLQQDIGIIFNVFTSILDREDNRHDISNISLTPKEKNILRGLSTYSQINEPLTIGDVQILSSAFFKDVERISTMVPHLQSNDFSIEPHMDDLLHLESFRAGNSQWEFPKNAFDQLVKDMYKLELKQRGLPRALLNLHTLHSTCKEVSLLLKDTDSVYLHQMAHAIDIYVENSLRVLHGSESTIGTDSMEQMIEQLSAVSLFAAFADQEGFSPMKFNDTGDVYFENMIPLLKSSDNAVVDTIFVPSHEQVQVLTGPNGSGKTFREKNITLTALMALATGYGPMTYGTMPLFDAVVYFDRVTQKEDASYSAGAQEIEYWKQLLALIQSPKRIFGVASIDELGSTMSARYQEAFSYAMVQTFMEESQKLLLATHNHSFVQAMLAAGTPGFMPYYLKFAIENGIVTFDRTIEPGIAASFPEEVARGMGFPPRILDISQQLL